MAEECTCAKLWGWAKTEDGDLDYAYCRINIPGIPASGIAKMLQASEADVTIITEEEYLEAMEGT